MDDSKISAHDSSSPTNTKDADIEVPLVDPEKSTWERLWPAMACGAGLFVSSSGKKVTTRLKNLAQDVADAENIFPSIHEYLIHANPLFVSSGQSDGYLQSVIGPVNTILSTLYPVKYAQSSAVSNVTSIAFAGTVLGQLVFGYTSDSWSRKWTLLVSTVILIVFAALGAGSYGAGGSVSGLLAALTAYRFLLGIGIGFVLFTNVQIDFGFVAGTLVGCIVTAIAPHHLHAVWRICLGLGVIPPLSLLYLRIKLKEPEAFSREKFEKKVPYWLALKFYGPRLAVVCVIWFIYDFLTYPFSIFSSSWLDTIAPDRDLWQNFGWSTVINCFYLPGAIAGAFLSDRLGPRLALSVFVAAQGIVGFIMSGCYPWLKLPENVGGFVVVYGIFLSLGEMGPGDNIGLVAAKSCATGIRGKYYAIAAACGKVGGFVGNYIFPYIIADGGGTDSVKGGQYPFYVASSLCLLSACIVWLLPRIDQDTIEKEDRRFRAYLVENGWDVSTMGDEGWREKRRASLAAQGMEGKEKEY
ncbi:glycerophosphoinositol permease [Saxophila tyrrhenica]|uniref:Glycerophosphoinositol permease n=1 Tax=Saxophila tyrrhenica TaxID=1690608 RepID=A0AAV9NVR8_9PEZI|nr:glycerophosphoinositol permease [Saxophila tyrrhenica]